MAKKKKPATKKATKKTVKKTPDGPPGPYTKTDRAARRFLKEIGADPNTSQDMLKAAWHAMFGG